MKISSSDRIGKRYKQLTVLGIRNQDRARDVSLEKLRFELKEILYISWFIPEVFLEKVGT